MLDFTHLFRNLSQNKVDYVLVGGFATTFYGGQRITIDVDLVIAISADNFARLAAAINPLHPRLRPKGPVIRLDHRPIGGKYVTLYTDAGRIDFFYSLADIPWSELSARAVRIPLLDFEVNVAAIEDLITMKRAAARPQDLRDIAELEWIRQHRPADAGPP
jgi:predicted nucleotidyltransferase